MADPEQLLRLSDEVRRIAAALEGLTGHAKSGSSMAVGPPPDISPHEVRYVIDARRKRSRYLPADLFAEPAWDMLLELLYAELVGTRLYITALCASSGVAATTALRWVNALVNQGVVIRKADPADGRRIFVELAPEVSAALRRYFAEVVQRRAA